MQVFCCTHMKKKNASNQFLILQLIETPYQVLNVQHTVPDMVVSINYVESKIDLKRFFPVAVLSVKSGVPSFVPAWDSIL